MFVTASILRCLFLTTSPLMFHLTTRQAAPVEAAYFLFLKVTQGPQNPLHIHATDAFPLPTHAPPSYVFLNELRDLAG